MAVMFGGEQCGGGLPSASTRTRAPGRRWTGKLHGAGQCAGSASQAAQSSSVSGKHSSTQNTVCSPLAVPPLLPVATMGLIRNFKYSITRGDLLLYPQS